MQQVPDLPTTVLPWREQLLQYGHQAFETKNITKKEKGLQNENQQLKQIIGDLTIELKKSEYLS